MDMAAVPSVMGHGLGSLVLLLRCVPTGVSLQMGDEYGHSKAGNNNTYCHDSALNWVDWKQVASDEQGFARFTRQLIAFRCVRLRAKLGAKLGSKEGTGFARPVRSGHARRGFGLTSKLDTTRFHNCHSTLALVLVFLRRHAHPELRRKAYVNDNDVQWHGEAAFKPDWTDSSRLVAYTLKKQGTAGGGLYVAFNSGHMPKVVELPNWHGRAWKVCVAVIDEDRKSVV